MEVSLPRNIADMLRWVTAAHLRRKMLPGIFRHDMNPFIPTVLKSASNPQDLMVVLKSCWEGHLWLANFVEATRSQQEFLPRLESILRRAGITLVRLEIDEEPGLNLDDLSHAAREARMDVTILELKEVRADHKRSKELARDVRAADIAALAHDQALLPVEDSMMRNKDRAQILAAVGRDLADIYGCSPARLTSAWITAYQKCAPQYERMCRLHRGDLKIADIVTRVLDGTNESWALGWSVEVMKFLGLTPASSSRTNIPLTRFTESNFVKWLEDEFRAHARGAFSKNGTWAQYRERSFKPLDAKTLDAKAIAGMLRAALDFAGVRIRGVSAKGAKRAITSYEMFWLWDVPLKKGDELPKPRPLHPKDFVTAAIADGAERDVLGSQGAQTSGEEDLSQGWDYDDGDADDFVDFATAADADLGGLEDGSVKSARTPANLSRTGSSALLPPAPKRPALEAATPQLDAPSTGRPSKRRVSSVPLFSLDPDATGSPAKDHGKPKPAKASRKARHSEAASDSDEEVLVSPNWRKQR